MSGVRKSTPRGQMTQGNSGPAVMLMPPQIRVTFMPNPPLKHIPPLQKKRKQKWTGVAEFMVNFEKTPAPERQILPTPKTIKAKRKQLQREAHQKELEPLIEAYRTAQRDSAGEFEGMNCYNTLFVGRLAYEVSERKLLREMESFGPIKDIKIVKDLEGKSRGYAFMEYEHEEDMKRAYRAADGMRIEGREVVVDVERGHTVPNWLPRRLSGGLGGTRLGGKDVNVTRPGRYDPSRPDPMVSGPVSTGMGRGAVVGRLGGFRDGPPPLAPPGPQGPPPPPYDYGGRGRVGSDRFGGGPSRDWDRGGGQGGRYPPPDGRKRNRSPSPDRRHGGGRRRY